MEINKATFSVSIESCQESGCHCHSNRKRNDTNIFGIICGVYMNIQSDSHPMINKTVFSTSIASCHSVSSPDRIQSHIDPRRPETFTDTGHMIRVQNRANSENRGSFIMVPTLSRALWWNGTHSIQLRIEHNQKKWKGTIPSPFIGTNGECLCNGLHEAAEYVHALPYHFCAISASVSLIVVPQSRETPHVYYCQRPDYNERGAAVRVQLRTSTNSTDTGGFYRVAVGSAANSCNRTTPMGHWLFRSIHSHRLSLSFAYALSPLSAPLHPLSPIEPLPPNPLNGIPQQ